MNVALKEWDVVCQALQSGRQMILLRKGGISESIGGFELEHSKFLLFPTFVHQNRAMLKSEAQAAVQHHSAEPDRIALAGWAEVTDIVQVASREQVDALEAEHIWTPPLIDMRFNYRPKNPLYLMVVRAHSLTEPLTIQNTPDYAGCKSWVPLTREIPIDGSTPALSAEAFTERRAQLLSGFINSR